MPLCAVSVYRLVQRNASDVQPRSYVCADDWPERIRRTKAHSREELKTRRMQVCDMFVSH